MTDAPFVIAAYAIVLGSLGLYVVSLVRRSAAARVAERAIKRGIRQR